MSRRLCRDTGLVWVDRTPPPRDVPAQYGEMLRAGRLVVLTAIPDESTSRKRNRDKTKQHLIMFYTFPLE